MFMLAHACITPYNSVYHQWSKIHRGAVENRRQLRAYAMTIRFITKKTFTSK